MNYNSHQKVCVTVYILVLDGKNLCLACFYDVVSDLDLNIEGRHATQHFAGGVNELTEKCAVCNICDLNLYKFCLAEFCMLCNHCTLETKAWQMSVFL